MNAIQPGQQIALIMPQGSEQVKGKTAQQANIDVAKVLADTVKSTLGPKGMDKLLVDSKGDVIVTNDGVTILNEINPDHPTAKMLVQVAKTQDQEVGDGTTTAVVIAGELIKNAESLLEQQIHPTVITKGYQQAASKAIDFLNEMTSDINLEDEEAAELLKRVAITAMTGKNAEQAQNELAEMIVEAAATVKNKEDIKIQKKSGESVKKSELIFGIVLDKEKVHPNMPDEVENAKILLLDEALEVKSPETDTQVQITDPDQLKGLLGVEKKLVEDMVIAVEHSGANVVLCSKGIDEQAQHYLSEFGIFGVRRVSAEDMKMLAKATGGVLIKDVNSVKPEHLGKADKVRQESNLAGMDTVFVEGCSGPASVTLLLRSATEHIADEMGRAVEDALGVVFSAKKGLKLVAGAGAVEAELAVRMRKYASTLSGREQLAVEAFANAMEVIPRTLAENAGLDPIDILAELRAAHGGDSEDSIVMGVDVFDGGILNAREKGILEPLQIKTQAISSAAEAAIMVLRIDDILSIGATPGQDAAMPGQ